MVRLRRARTRIAVLAALVSLASLALVAAVTASILHHALDSQTDEGLDTLVEAIGSDIELRGLQDMSEDALRVGLESNVFEFRLEHHSAILFRGSQLIARTGDIPRVVRPAQLADLDRRGPQPFTAVEEFTGQRRICRFRVAHLSGRADGATLVVFRAIKSRLRTEAWIDRALIVLVLVGAAASGLILIVATRQALLPVERMTAAARAIGAQDLSRRVPAGRGAEEFTRLAAVINDLLDRLERAFAVERRLTEDAAHELKTPVAVIVAETQEALRAEATTEERTASMLAVLDAARGLAQSADDMLTLARSEAGAPRRDERLGLRALVDGTVRSVAPVAATHGVTLFSEVEDVAFTGDRAGLTRMLSNLIKNAVQYSPSLSAVEVAGGEEGGWVWLEVRDRGPGIAEEQRERVFERFVRLAGGRASNPPGAGLGLAIVAEVARTHAGRAFVRERDGGGSIFRVELPVTPTSEKAPRVDPSATQGARDGGHGEA